MISKSNSEVTGRILVVDDDETARTIHRAALSTQFKVETSHSGEDALQKCREDLPDLILLDVVMPTMDGYETCHKLREFTDIPIIFVTSNDTLDEHMMAFDAGGDDIIVKPVTKELLLRKASIAIQKERRQHQLKNEKNTLQDMAMSFLSAVGENGVLRNFMQSSLKCRTPASLGEQLVAAIKEFGLECSVSIQVEDASIILTTHGEASAIEKSVLEQASSMGRVFQFKRNLAVNYENVSVIVSNMPIDTADKADRLRDHITMLAEMTDTMCGNVAMHQLSNARAEQLQVAMAAAFHNVDLLRAVSRSMQIDARLLLQEMVDTIEKSYSWLGTSREQEREISQAMYISVDKILNMLEKVSSQSNEKFDKILTALNAKTSAEDIDMLF